MLRCWQESGDSEATERGEGIERGASAQRRRWGRFWHRRSPDAPAKQPRPGRQGLTRRGLAVATSCAHTLGLTPTLFLLYPGPHHALDMTRPLAVRVDATPFISHEAAASGMPGSPDRRRACGAAVVSPLDIIYELI